MASTGDDSRVSARHREAMTTSEMQETHLNRSSGALRLTAVASLVGGAALVVDTVTITVLNDHFGVLDDVLFFVGLIGLFITLFALATAASARSAGMKRVALGVGVFIGVFVVMGILAELMDEMGKRMFSPANIGLHEEWTFFTVGVCLLLIAGWANRARVREAGHYPSRA